MKIKFLMVGLLGLISATSFAQKGELNTAQSEYEKYDGLKTAQPKLAMPSLDKAKEAIDKAAANPKTANLPQTYAVKANVYGALAELDTVSTTSLPKFNTAAEALAKAKELDKGDNKKSIDNAQSILAAYQSNKGVKEYQAGKYDLAYKSFDYYRNVFPEDTNAVLYTALAAYNSKNYPAAITNYSKLTTLKYSKAETLYGDLASIYLATKDTTGALKTITDGLVKYPNNADLRRTEIEISLQQGKQKEVLDKITSAIANDPKNKNLYYYAGLVYSNTADDAGQKLIKTPAAGKAALQAEKTQNMQKAAEMYKKALEIDPNYFEANLNMGYVLLSPAIDTYNAANKLPANQQKAYEVAVAKANTQFDVAKPYLLKAVELNPKSADALNNLLTYYKGKRDNANIAKTNALIAALPK